jgi:hypothetical protein
MTHLEVQTLLAKLLRREEVPFDPPTEADWKVLESRFRCRFGDEFKAFIALMSEFTFPGEILNVSRVRTNGNDAILIAYDLEMKHSTWDERMIPFYAIGNGDYFCLASSECPQSRVFYYDHETEAFEPYCDSFEVWLRQLPDFLA